MNAEISSLNWFCVMYVDIYFTNKSKSLKVFCLDYFINQGLYAKRALL